MSKKTTQTIADITLNTGEPTDVDREHLFQWVVWQFPRPHDGGLCAAARPPLPNHGWYPAIVHLQNNKVRVFGHLDLEFDSPETAAEFFS